MRRTHISLVFILSLITSLFTASSAQSQQNTYLDDVDYLLNTGDTIQITVHQETDLSMQVLLNKAGQFSYPYLGLITASKKTSAALAREIEDRLRGDYLIFPSVSVGIVEYRNFYVGGEVRTPGGYAYKPGLTIKQAIVIAGGQTEWASSSKYRIQRENSSEYAKANEDTPVYPGDTVTVEAGLF